MGSGEAAAGGSRLLWGGGGPAARGPRRALSLDEVAAAAVLVADRDGLEGLSMQRVAAEVGLTKMGLYRYVASREELEAVMVDAAVEEPPGPGEFTGTWREQAEELVARIDRVWTRHPWLPWVTIGERLMGPREVGWVEAAVRVFEPLALTPHERMDAVSMLFGHLRVTHAAASAGTRPWTADPEGGTTMRDLVAENTERFPALTAVMAAGRPPVDARYAFGLRCLLDGLEVAAGRGSAT